MSARLRFSVWRLGLLRWGLMLIGWGGAAGGAAGQGPVVLRTAEEVRRLTTDQAAEGRPVELQGVLTFFDQKQFSRFVQDGTAGIYMTDFTGYPELKAGDKVRVTGQTDAGEYAPVVRPLRVERLGRRAMPVARPVVFEDLASGREDSQWVEMSGVVRQEIRERGGRTVALDLATGGGRLRLEMGAAALAEGQEWVDCVVRVQGVCSSSFNRGRQLFRSRLLVPQAEDLVVEKRPAANAFEQEIHPLGSLLRFAPQGTLGHRIKVKGTVVYQGAGFFTLMMGSRVCW